MRDLAHTGSKKTFGNSLNVNKNVTPNKNIYGTFGLHTTQYMY